MEFFGIIDALRDYCEDNSWFFIPGLQQYQNAVADLNVYENNDIIMIAFFRARPRFENAKCVGMTYQGSIALGSKRESVTVNDGTIEEPHTTTTLTESSLDETWEQKYDNRLKMLGQLLLSTVSSVACSNELEIQNANVEMIINKFDLNADFVEMTLDLIQ